MCSCWPAVATHSNWCCPAGAFFTHLTDGPSLAVAAPPVRPRTNAFMWASVRHCSRRTGSGSIGHHISDPLVRTVRRRDRLLVDPASLFCQLSATLRVEDLVAVGDALVLTPRFAEGRRPALEHLGELLARVECVPRARRGARPRHSPWSTGAESRPESLVRVAIVNAGLPELGEPRRLQLGRPLPRLRDLVYDKWRVIVEDDARSPPGGQPAVREGRRPPRSILRPWLAGDRITEAPLGGRQECVGGSNRRSRPAAGTG